MKKFSPFILIGAIMAFMSNMVFSLEQLKIGIVNIPQIFNNSQFIKDENKKLQTNVKHMEDQVQEEQKKLQDLIQQYGKNKEASLQIKIAEAQTKLTEMTQNYQKKLQAEQNASIQKFNAMVHDATEKVAKQRHLNAVRSEEHTSELQSQR